MKIGIIGSGISGLLTAWLIEHEHEVVIFEKQNFIGGHAHTIPVTVDGTLQHINYGFEFFTENAFPYLNKLLHLLQVDTFSYGLSTNFYKTGQDLVILPPSKDGKILWKMALSNVATFAQLSYVLYKIQPFLDKNDMHTTLEEFIENLVLTRTFKQNFFYPYIAAGWGAPIELFKKFSAYDVLYWFKDATGKRQAPVWKEVKGGVSAYISALAKELQKTPIKLQSAISGVSYEDKKYTVNTAAGEKTEVDLLVIATNAEDALGLIQDVSHTDELQSILKTIEHFSVQIAVHSDTNFMPRNRDQWCILNLRHDSQFSTMTIYKPWQGDIFRSWLSPEDKQLPSNLYSLTDFRHVCVNSAYFKAQKRIEKCQGQNSLWLAGLYTGGIDSHESAIKSALNIAKKLSPTSERLSRLLGRTSQSRCPFMHG